MATFAFAFLDCEFGGLDPELHDITEIAVIMTDERLVEFAQAEWKVSAREERITKEAAKISGYDPEVWRTESVALPQALNEFSSLCPENQTVVPAGQNVRMDVQFLERAYKNTHIDFPFDYHTLDLATLFYSYCLIGGKNVKALSLRRSATVAGLSDGSVPHRAMADARLTLETFRYYIENLQISPEKRVSSKPSP
ncbi:3'-5' exonuclease [Myxococcota bacterium]|nr:3'-5' exonuclease [Myxococcota bacterium]